MNIQMIQFVTEVAKIRDDYTAKVNPMVTTSVDEMDYNKEAVDFLNDVLSSAPPVTRASADPLVKYFVKTYKGIHQSYASLHPHSATAQVGAKVIEAMDNAGLVEWNGNLN